jgi:hypothetical protein
MTMQLTFRRQKPSPTEPESVRETRFRAYSVFAADRHIGTVKQVDHTRLGERWMAYDLAGNQVSEATHRKHAAAALFETVS